MFVLVEKCFYFHCEYSFLDFFFFFFEKQNIVIFAISKVPASFRAIIFSPAVIKILNSLEKERKSKPKAFNHSLISNTFLFFK